MVWDNQVVERASEGLTHLIPRLEEAASDEA